MKTQGLVAEHLVNLAFTACGDLQLNFLIEPEGADPEGVLQAFLELPSSSGSDMNSAWSAEREG